jgi:hypothetical protein
MTRTASPDILVLIPPHKDGTARAWFMIPNSHKHRFQGWLMINDSSLKCCRLNLQLFSNNHWLTSTFCPSPACWKHDTKSVPHYFPLHFRKRFGNHRGSCTWRIDGTCPWCPGRISVSYGSHSSSCPHIRTLSNVSLGVKFVCFNIFWQHRIYKDGWASWEALHASVVCLMHYM